MQPCEISYTSTTWLLAGLLVFDSDFWKIYNICVSRCSLKQNTGDLHYRGTAQSASRSSTGCCRVCTTFQELMCYWAMPTSMEICFPSTMMTIFTKRCLLPILCWGLSSRGEVRTCGLDLGNTGQILLHSFVVNQPDNNTKGLLLWKTHLSKFMPQTSMAGRWLQES